MEIKHISKGNQLKIEKVPSLEKGKRKKGIKFEVEFIKCLISNVPEIRENKVREAKQRLQNGVYLRADISERIAERIMASMKL